MRVVIAGGGTGGHLFPGIAVAREILRRDPKATVTFVGTAAGLEARVIPKEAFPLDLIRVAGLKGKSPRERLRGLSLLPLAGRDAWRVITTRRPDVVVGVGGFASGPVLALAAARGLPTMLLEQNATPGFTNRRLARVVHAAALTFEATLPFFPDVGVVTGNPVRPEFAMPLPDETSSAGGATRVLVFGGSQGAHALNLAMVAAAPLLASSGVQLQITHQTGEKDLETVREGYMRSGIDARIDAFLFAMPDEMRRADLVVCRAGATTLAELAASGRPAILVPLPTATDDHQRQNASVIAAEGGAVLLEQRKLSGERLSEAVLGLVRDAERRAAMATAMRRLARPEAASRIVDLVWQLAGTTPGRASSSARSIAETGLR